MEKPYCCKEDKGYLRLDAESARVLLSYQLTDLEKRLERLEESKRINRKLMDLEFDI